MPGVGGEGWSVGFAGRLFEVRVFFFFKKKNLSQRVVMGARAGAAWLVMVSMVSHAYVLGHFGGTRVCKRPDQGGGQE